MLRIAALDRPESSDFERRSADAAGETIGAGALGAQVEQCYLNVATALAEAAASFDDVVKLTVYVVDLTPNKMPPFADGLARAEVEAASRRTGRWSLAASSSFG